MDVTDLILNKKFKSVPVGGDVDVNNDIGLDPVLEQEKGSDIPSIYQYDSSEFCIFFDVLGGKLCRVVLDFTYELNERYSLVLNQNTFQLDGNTSINSLMSFFKENDFTFRIEDSVKSDLENVKSYLFISDDSVLFYFFEGGLVKVHVQEEPVVLLL